MDDEPRQYLFGPFALDAESDVLSRDGERIPLPPQPARLLRLLVESGGRLVGREEIQCCLDRIESKKAKGGCWRDLETHLRQALGRVLMALRMDSEHILEDPVELRRSFTAVVPGILGPVLIGRRTL